MGTEHGIYKSIDGGETWEPLDGQGLPACQFGTHRDCGCARAPADAASTRL